MGKPTDIFNIISEFGSMYIRLLPL